MDLSITIASGGRFWAFDLAFEMQKRGVLKRLYTAYPKWKVDQIHPKLVRSAPWLSLPLMGMGRIGLQTIQAHLELPANRGFDYWLSSVIESSSIFHCLSGYGAKSHVIAHQKFGSMTVCDRGSSHIEFQRDILIDEYSRWGNPYKMEDGRIDCELAEYEECDLIVVPSSFVRKTFMEKGINENKISLVPYGVDLSCFHPVPKTNKIFRVIYVGALSLRKGIPYLLQAFSDLNLPNFEVWLIGGVTKEVKQIINNFPGPFKYLGFIPRKELYRYYSQGSVFVLASIEEGLALVQSQAMACGLPVIATTNTGAENLFTDGVEGFIIPIRDPQVIREKVLYLYENPQVRDEMAQRALERVQHLGGWRTYGDEILKTYQRLLANKTKAQ
jgi:glycosyltransferase involved in cell wall biosynthesis